MFIIAKHGVSLLLIKKVDYKMKALNSIAPSPLRDNLPWSSPQGFFTLAGAFDCSFCPLCSRSPADFSPIIRFIAGERALLF